MRFSYSLRKMVELFANSGDSDQTPRLQITLLGVSRLQWVNYVLLQKTDRLNNDVKIFRHTIHMKSVKLL